MSFSIISEIDMTASSTWFLGVNVPGQRTGDPVPEGTMAGEVIKRKAALIVEAESEEPDPLAASAGTPLQDGNQALPGCAAVLPRRHNRGPTVKVRRTRHLFSAGFGPDLAGYQPNRRSHRQLSGLLKEINHRVKNKLQIISILLDLHSRHIQDEQALPSFQASQDRIRVMDLVHEKLYMSEDSARIDFREYIKSLATDVSTPYGLGARDIDLKIDVENILLGVDIAIPCGAIGNELAANSLKHGFPRDRSCEIVISFREVDGQYTTA